MRSQPQIKEFSVERQQRKRRGNGPGGVTNADLLDAIDTLEQRLAGLGGAAASRAAVDPGVPEPATEDAVAARIEIAAMVRMIRQAKTEIASIRHPEAEDDRMNAATSELDAIVLATETSTNDVLNASEQIELLVREMSGLHPDDEEIRGLAEQAAAEIIKIFEACNFQDITGQRITKVVNTIRFIEERILAMINIWGVEAFAELPASQTTQPDGDKALMNGPQLPDQGISQDDINALFD